MRTKKKTSWEDSTNPNPATVSTFWNLFLTVRLRCSDGAGQQTHWWLREIPITMEILAVWGLFLMAPSLLLQQVAWASAMTHKNRGFPVPDELWAAISEIFSFSLYWSELNIILLQPFAQTKYFKINSKSIHLYWSIRLRCCCDTDTESWSLLPCVVHQSDRLAGTTGGCEVMLSEEVLNQHLQRPSHSGSLGPMG